MFCCAAAKCAIAPTPTVKSEENTDQFYPASSALTDNDLHWLGNRNMAAGFVIDLGKVATVTDIHLRNANEFAEE